MRAAAPSFRPCVLLACLAGCNEPSPGDMPSDRFDIVTDFEGPICAGNLRHLEERLAWLEATFNLPVEGRVRFEWYESEHMNCNGHAGGCAEGLTIAGPWESADHELVHLVLGSLGRAKTFLAEGAAVAYSEAFLLLQNPDPPSLWLDCDVNVIGEYSGPECYRVAGHFVYFLIDRYGMQRFKDLYRSSDHADSAEQFRADVARIYGEDLAAIEAEYLATARDVYPGMAGCGAPAIPWDGGAYSEDFSVACDDPDVLRIDAANMQRTVHFELSGSARGAFAVDGNEQYVASCVSEPHDVGAPEPQGEFAAGTHTVYLTAPIDAPTVERVTFTPE